MQLLDPNTFTLELTTLIEELHHIPSNLADLVVSIRQSDKKTKKK